MIRMPRATDKYVEAVLRLRLTFCGVLLFPVRRTLVSNRRHHHGHSSVKSPQGLVFVRRFWLRELAFPVARIPGLRNPRADVVTQVPCQVQHQVSHAVAVRKRLLPELLVVQRIHPFVQLLGHIFVIRRQSVCNSFVWRCQFLHLLSNRMSIRRPTIPRPFQKSSRGRACAEAGTPPFLNSFSEAFPLPFHSSARGRYFRTIDPVTTV